MKTDEVDIMARTIYGEARGEKLRGMEAVASVIANRAKFAQKRGGWWWGNTITEVCLKPWQFSCWNKNDANYKRVQTVDEKDPLFLICRRVAARAVSGLLKDTTCGATHYHVLNLRPKWSVGKIPCAEIGRHVFYNDIEE